MNIEVVDLFCGVGGLTCGLIQSGLRVKAGFDIDETCKYPYEYNNKAKFYNKDIRKVTGDEINKCFSKNAIKILAGCAPCQPFSQMSFKYQSNEAKKRENDKLYVYFYADLLPEKVCVFTIWGSIFFHIRGTRGGNYLFHRRPQHESFDKRSDYRTDTDELYQSGLVFKWIPQRIQKHRHHRRIRRPYCYFCLSSLSSSQSCMNQ